MNETMRDYLKRRLQLAGAILVIGLVLIFLRMIALIALGPHEVQAHWELYTWARFTGFALLIGGSALRSRVRCPKCDQRVLSGRWSGLPAVCPKCGVNFDEPLPQNPISPIS